MPGLNSAVMSHYTVTLALTGLLAGAVAVEWTNDPVPADSGRGWEPCLRLPDGAWRFASHDPAAGLHRRGPGRFADLAIRYRLEPAGPWSAASASRKEIVILEIGEEPEDPSLFFGPAATVLPGLAGPAVIGTELTLDPGIWTGFPAPTLAFQWRRDGVAIPGATARTHAPDAADDRCAIDCVVIASSSVGRAEAVAGPVAVRYAAPTLRADPPEEIFDESEGVELVETALVFAGENLTFTAKGFVIDPRTGVLSLPVDRPVSGGIVTIVASNSGGAAAATLRYTVEAAVPFPLAAEDATILQSIWRPEGQAGTFSPNIAFPGLGGEAVQAIEFTVDAPGAGAPAWHPVRAQVGEPGVWRLFDARHPVAADAPDAALWGPATPRANRLRFRWRRTEAGPWAPESPTHAIPEPKADYVVSTTAELLARMRSAQPGQVIACRGGAYAALEQDNLRNAGAQIVVRALDRNDPPIFPRIRMNGIRGFVFDGLSLRNTVMDQAFPDFPATRAFGFRADSCQNLTLRNCVFDSYHVGLVSTIGSQNLTIEWCHFTRGGMDSLRAFGGHRNLVIRNNRFDAPNVDATRSGDDDRHPDFIQFAVNGNQDPGVEVLVENNELTTFNGYHQAIFVKNARVVEDGADFATVGFRNIVIRGNWIRSRHVHGIALGGVNDMLVEGNLIQLLDIGHMQVWTTQGKGIPRISLISPYNTGIIRNNVMPQDFNLYENGSLADIATWGNHISATALPQGWTYPKAGPYGYEG